MIVCILVLFAAYKYAGVQNGDQCFCGDTYGKYTKKPDSECNKTCRGESTQMCGGRWRNAIYSTGYLGND